MSDELSSLIHAAAGEEAAAAERELPLSSATLDRLVGRAHRHRVALGATLAVAGVVVVGAAVLGLAQIWPTPSLMPGGTPSPSSSSSVGSSVSPSPSNEASPSPSLTPATSPTVITPSPTTTTPQPAVPAAVSNLTAGPGGGSGEIVVQWTGTPDATGYRVYRSSPPGHSMTHAASYSVATGSTTVEFGGTYEFIQIWSPSPNTFEYVEAVDGQPGYFVVAAFNSAGEGPLQGTVCAVPMAQSGTC